MKPIRQARRAFTLIEILLVLAILAVVTAAVLGIFGQIYRQWGGQITRSKGLQSANLGLNLMGKEAVGAVTFAATDTDGTVNVFTLPADKDASGNAVPAPDADGVLTYRAGASVRFYLSDLTGNPAAAGTILWRAARPAGGSVWTPDSTWSLGPDGKGRVPNVSALAFSTAGVASNVVRVTLSLRFAEGGLSSVYTARRDMFLSSSNDAVLPGVGLIGRYYTTINFGALLLTRTDPRVNFAWYGSQPDPSVPGTNFSVRWTGQIYAPVSGTYVFSTRTDDGVRLWVNGQQLINDWNGHPETINTAAGVTLTAGQKYDIKMEYMQGTGSSYSALSWTYPGQTSQVVAQTFLYPGDDSAPAPPTGLTAANAGSNTATLTWTSSANAASYNLYRATQSGGPYVRVGGSLTGTSKSDTGLSAGATYFYAVSPTNGDGAEGNNSGEVSLTLPPAAPTNLTVSAGSASANLTWAATSGATSYNLYRATTSGGEGATPVQSGLTGTSYVNTSLTSGTTYFYKLAAVNAGGVGPMSAEAGPVTAQ